MEIVMPGGAFRVLLLLVVVSSHPAAVVPPPVNVTVSCLNVRSTVRWDYSPLLPNTSFMVQVNGSEGGFEVETVEHQYDLSPFLWQSKRHYLGFHYVNVTARRGGEWSKAVESQSFTYNDMKIADVKCVLEFPPVTVATEETGTTVRFQNPFSFYQELKQAQKPDSASFHFCVSSDQGEFKSQCQLTEKICRLDLPPSDGEQCVTLQGWLKYEGSVESVLFSKTLPVCPTASSNGHILIFGIFLSIFVLGVIATVTACICKEKAWTMMSSTDVLDVKPTPTERLYNTVVRADISPVTVVSRPCLSLSDLTEGGTPLDSSSTSGHVEREASEGGNQEAMRLMCTADGTDEDSADDSVKTECVLIEEDEDQPVPQYDRPHVLLEDFGDGDMVECYTTR